MQNKLKSLLLKSLSKILVKLLHDIYIYIYINLKQFLLSKFIRAINMS